MWRNYMRVINNTPIFGVQSTNFKQNIKNQNTTSTISYQPINLNNLNPANRSLVKFTGYGPDFQQTLNDNYFNLPTDPKTG